MENNYGFSENEVSAISSFLALAHYNGYEDDIKDILKELKKSFAVNGVYDCICISRPDWKSKCGKDKIDEFGGIFWSWLISQYGDYGTSPRYGWIYKDNGINLYKIIKKLWENYRK